MYEMETLALTDWSPGLRKVSLTKLLQREGGLSLREAKLSTDRFLEGEYVKVEFTSLEEAHQFAAEASRLGVTVKRVVRKYASKSSA